MKKLCLLFLIFSSVNAFAQIGNKTDSIYYLLDTAKTPIADRMWDIHADNGSIFGNNKIYVIQCPCLKNGGKPSFFYASGDRGEGLLINKKQLKALKTISLGALIAKSKQIESNGYKSDVLFFVIEPKGRKYAVHEMYFLSSAMEVHALPDVLPSKRDNSAFEVKGLINVSSKDLAKYINQVVITSGEIVNAKEIENGGLGLLMVGADYPDQDFTIVIKGKNLGNFYPMKFYKKRWLTVTGKVTEYMGKPAIELIDERQIR